MPHSGQIDTGSIEWLILKNLLRSPLPKPSLEALPLGHVKKENTDELGKGKLKTLLGQPVPEDNCSLFALSMHRNIPLSISGDSLWHCTSPTASQRAVSKLKPILPNISQLTGSIPLALVAKTTQEPPQRPNCTYPVLIALALYAAETGTLTVKGIYQFIETHFEYYRNSYASNWRNSVRHCLSENKAFVKASTSDVAAVCKGHWWTIALDKKDGLEKEIVRFLSEETYDMRHIEPLGKFYAEIEFNRIQEKISSEQALQLGASPANMLSGWASPNAAHPAVNAEVHLPQIQQNTSPHSVGVPCNSIDSDFQDVLRDVMSSAWSEAAGAEIGAEGDCAFDEDFVESLFAEMPTVPLLLEGAADPEAVPPAVAEKGAVGSTCREHWNQTDSAMNLMNTLDIQQDLLEELKDPSL